MNKSFLKLLIIGVTLAGSMLVSRTAAPFSRGGERVELSAFDNPSDIGAPNTSSIKSLQASSVAQVAQALSHRGVPLVMPTFVPQGFRLTHFQTEGLDESVPSRYIGYDATYQGPNNCEIDIGGSNGGWGAPGPVRQWIVNTPLFGEIILEEWEWHQGPNYLNAAALPDVDSERGVLPDFPNAGYVFNFSCRYSVFSPQQAAQVLMSMQIFR